MAKAFYEGRACKRGNCETDGMYYWLAGNCIAARENRALEVAFMLQNEGKKMQLMHHGPTMFSFARWPTKMTARHLSALGLDASCIGIKNPSPRFRNVEVDCGKWYTKEEIDALVAPPPVPVKVREPRFVNLTAELFPA